MKHTDFMSIAGANWNKLSEKDKLKYEKLASVDKVRFEK